MPKAKIGKDILEKGKGGIISTPKESKEYQEWLEEQEQAKKAEEAEEIEGKELKSEMPEEPEPTPDQLAKERFELQQEVAKAKLEGKLKVIPEQQEE
jgi:hypothetical protein